MSDLEQVLYLNIGLNGDRDPATNLGDALFYVGMKFGHVYSVEVFPGKTEPTLVVAVHTRENFIVEVEEIAQAMRQDSIAYKYKVKGSVVEHGFIGHNNQRLTWDENKFITPRIYWSMTQ